MAKRRNIVGVSWRRLHANQSPSPRSKNVDSPACRKSTLRTGSSLANVQAKVMTRMMSFRDTFDTLRQRVRQSTRTRKRLTNATPSPYGPARKSSTPRSSQRKAIMKGNHREVKMYSPFEFVTPTPARTPVKSIRMGIQPCKRFAFSSNGGPDIEKEVVAIADGIESLASKDNMSPSPACPPRSSRIHRSGIRTTPKATNGRSSSKQPLFV